MPGGYPDSHYGQMHATVHCGGQSGDNDDYLVAKARVGSPPQ